MAICIPNAGNTSLKDMLQDIDCGRLQLPAFQRGWRWDKDLICRLAASLTLGYPIGAAMLLESRRSDADAQFGARLFEGVPDENGNKRKNLQHLVLDGQQRLTSLYRALYRTEPVLMPDEKPSLNAGLLFYLDIKKCLDDSDRLEAVVAVPGNRILKNFRENGAALNLSTKEKEFDAGMFPLNAVFHATEWFKGWIQQDQNRWEIYDAFKSKILDTVEKYQLPVITLSEDTPMEAVCQIFENVNRGGVVLTVFELVTAKYARCFDLRADWENEVGPAVHGEGKKLSTDLMHAVDEKDFLTAVTLFASYRRNEEKVAAGLNASSPSCKKGDVLGLSLDDYKKYRGQLIEGFQMARDFLLNERIYMQKDLPYVSQLIPLAAICAAVGKELLVNQNAAAVLSRWYWCGVLGEKYNGPIETYFSNDMDDVPRAMKAAAEGKTPLPPVRTADAAFFSATRLLSMRSRNSAAYKGLMALIWKGKALDLLAGTEMDAAHAIEKRPDIHHIFPKAWCQKNGDEYARANMDSIVNKTPLTPDANNFISGDAPSDYMKKIMQKAGICKDDLRRRIATHFVDLEAFEADAFKPHFIFRAKKLLNLIEDAMGKKVADRGSVQTQECFGASLEDNEQVPPSQPVHRVEPPKLSTPDRHTWKTSSSKPNRLMDMLVQKEN